jgi:hypothetical protein
VLKATRGWRCAGERFGIKTTRVITWEQGFGITGLGF